MLFILWMVSSSFSAIDLFRARNLPTSARAAFKSSSIGLCDGETPPGDAPAAASSAESARLRRFSASSNFDTNLSNPPRFMTVRTIRRGSKGRQPGRNSRASRYPPHESPSPILYRKGWFSASNGSVKDCVFWIYRVMSRVNIWRD